MLLLLRTSPPGATRLARCPTNKYWMPGIIILIIIMISSGSSSSSMIHSIIDNIVLLSLITLNVITVTQHAAQRDTFSRGPDEQPLGALAKEKIYKHNMNDDSNTNNTTNSEYINCIIQCKFKNYDNCVYIYRERERKREKEEEREGEPQETMAGPRTKSGLRAEVVVEGQQFSS